VDGFLVLYYFPTLDYLRFLLCKKFRTLLLCAIVLAGCTPRDGTQYDLNKGLNSGASSALVNGRPYVSSITNARWENNFPGKFGLSLSVYIDGFERQELAIVKIDPLLKSQHVYSDRLYIGNNQYQSLNTDLCNSLFFLSFYDEMENTYYLLDSAKNIVNIESYEQETGTIKGNFDLTFFRVDKITHQQTQGFEDTLHFTSGKFETIIKE